MATGALMPSNDRRLLYVEDDEALAQITQRSLSKRGILVTHSASIADAKQVNQQFSFSHALLDLKVDDGNALELIPTLTRTHPGINILVLTGYASIATAVQSIKLGANNYLSKPVTIDDILNAFEDLTPGNSSCEEAIAGETMSVRRLEWEHIQRALTENGGNISATARQLKMHRRTLQRKLQKKPVSQ